MVDFIVGLCTALLAGLGVGGGGLLVIYLVLIKNYEQLMGQGINLIFFVFSSLSAMIIHIKKRKIPYILVLVIALFGTVGALMGCVLAKEIDSTVIRMIFGFLLIISGGIALFK